MTFDCISVMMGVSLLIVFLIGAASAVEISKSYCRVVDNVTCGTRWIETIANHMV